MSLYLEVCLGSKAIGPQGESYIPVYFNRSGSTLTWNSSLTLDDSLNEFAYVPLSNTVVFRSGTLASFSNQGVRELVQNQSWGTHLIGQGQQGETGPAGASVSAVNVSVSANQGSIDPVQFPDGGTRYDINITLTDGTIEPTVSFIAATGCLLYTSPSPRDS